MVGKTFSWMLRGHKSSYIELQCRWTHKRKGRMCTAMLCENEDIERTKASFSKDMLNRAVIGGGWLDDGKLLRIA